MQNGMFDPTALSSARTEPSHQTTSASAIADYPANEQMDPQLQKFRNAIDGYRARVSAWEQAIRPMARKQNAPSPTTVGLLILGAFVSIAINGFALDSDASTQQVALSNLGAMALFIVAGLSLFYDRAVRGFGRELVLRRSGEHASEISIQLHAIASMHVELQTEMQRARIDLLDLETSIEKQNEIAEDLKQQNVVSLSQQQEYEAKLDELRHLVMEEVSRLSRTQHGIANLENEQKELELSIQAHTDQLFDVAAQRETVTAELSRLESTQESARIAWAAEQQQLEADIQELCQEKELIARELQEVRRELQSLRELRTEMQCELEMIRDEHERSTAASIATIGQLRSEIESLQNSQAHERDQLQKVSDQLRGVRIEHEGLLSRIVESTAAKEELEDELSKLLSQIREKQAGLDAIEAAFQREEGLLLERRAMAEREAAEADSLQKERSLALQGLELSIGTAAQEREALSNEIQRLGGVKDAMEISIDELTLRLEVRTSELRKKNNQLQEQADRLERLSEAIQKLASRESEIRRTTALDESVAIDVLPSPHGTYRGVHAPHLAGGPRNETLSPSSIDDRVQGALDR
jgi:chromosome segregation ATPase